MKIPLLALIFQGIPEQIAVAALAFSIANITQNWKRIILIGAILAFTSYILRLLPITFGIHTVFIMGLLFVLLILIGKGNINSSLIASLISFLTLIIVETACLTLLMPLFGITSEILFSNTTIRILITLPQVLVIFVLSFIIFRIRARKKHIKL
ncbi:MAG: hypothetical protein GX434_05080 [Peptococcaceae bacterium]|nr:hypothetical protein [Peptococcaceae bacterium]